MAPDVTGVTWFTDPCGERDEAGSRARLTPMDVPADRRPVVDPAGAPPGAGSPRTGPVMLVVGARPNFMKIAPLQAELDRRGIESVLVHTGQHYDAAMSDVFFEELGIRAPDHHLEVGSASHAVQTARIMEAFEPVVTAAGPSWVVVPGDVNSTLACSLVAAKLGIRVAHLEAGLRSRDWAMPEEINRVVTDRVSNLLLAPSSDAVDNLRAEGYPPESIALVGNIMADTLLGNLERARQRPILAELGLEPGSYGMVTLHRPSNVDDPATLASLLETLEEVAATTPLVWPVHPRVKPNLPDSSTIRTTTPLGYLDAIALQADARLLLTDSGGMQEESTILGVPCVTLRTTTERPVTLTHGTNQLVGTSRDAIVAAVDRVLAGAITGRRPDLWDGQTASRVVDALESPGR
jgi:UDP-N-acetylglucosamine 2-epimerase (non-hydrolysing)